MTSPYYPVHTRDGTISVAARKALDLASAFVLIETRRDGTVVETTLTLEQALEFRKALDVRIDHVATLIALKDAVGRSAA